MTKNSRQKFKYLENKKSFQGGIKSILINFKSLSVAKNCPRPESASLITTVITNTETLRQKKSRFS